MSSLATGRGIWVVAGITILITALAAVNINRERVPADAAIVSPSGEEFYAYLSVANRVVLPGANPDDRLLFSTELTSSRPVGLHGLTATGDKRTLFTWKLRSKDNPAEGLLPVTRGSPTTFELPGRVAAFSVIGGSGAHRKTFFVQEVGSRARILELDQSSSGTEQPGPAGLTPKLPELPAGGTRSFSFVRSAGRPDLYVADGSPDLTWRIIAFSGESAYRKEILSAETTEVISGKLSSREWSSSVVKFEQDAPADLVLFTGSRRSGSSFTELHLLTGSSDFEDFPIRIPTELYQEPNRQQTLLVSSATGTDPNLFGIVNLISDGDIFRLRWLPFTYE